MLNILVVAFSSLHNSPMSRFLWCNDMTRSCLLSKVKQPSTATSNGARMSTQVSTDAITSNIPHHGARPDSDFHRNISSEDDETRHEVLKVACPPVETLHVPTERGDGPVSGSTSRYKSPGTSQSRMSISKKSLREISKDDLRLSGVSECYCS